MRLWIQLMKEALGKLVVVPQWFGDGLCPHVKLNQHLIVNYYSHLLNDLHTLRTSPSKGQWGCCRMILMRDIGPIVFMMDLERIMVCFNAWFGHPDIRLIEQIWDIFERAISTQDPSFTQPQNYIRLFKMVWLNISPSHFCCLNSSLSMSSSYLSASSRRCHEISDKYPMTSQFSINF